jgi:hypothetical protein
LPPYSSAWGAGLCCPATAPGWLANGWGWQGAAPLVFSIMRVHGGSVLAGMWREREGKKNSKTFLSSPAARSGEGVVQNDTVLVFFFKT